MSNQDQFDKNFWKHYQFWILICTALSIFAIAYFSCQSHKIQVVLRSIEETRQREKFSNDLEIIFSSNTFSGCIPEKAKYDLRLLNKSSQNFKELETTVFICYEDSQTKDLKKLEIFTLPQKDLFPSDLPIRLVENPDLTKTFCFNISEARKTIPSVYKPTSFEFFFKWFVEIGDGDYLSIEKRRNFSLRR
jgi:hypothetical protein